MGFLTMPDPVARPACAWCGRAACPRWLATARVVGISARRIMGRARPEDDLDAAIEAQFAAADDPVCKGPKDD